MRCGDVLAGEHFKAYGTELWVLIRDLRFTVRTVWLCFQIKAYGTGEMTRKTILVHLARTVSPKCVK